MIILQKNKNDTLNMVKTFCWYFLTLSMTLVMVAFSMQFTIIDVIKLNETISKNILQNPISEEEEEESADTNADHYIYVQNQFDVVGFEQGIHHCINNSCSNYRIDVFKTLNDPPESQL